MISELLLGHVTQALARGWSVIPTAIDKKPILASWKEFQERQPTLDEVRAWFDREPAGFAVVTGAVSGVVVLDFDGAKGRETLQCLRLKPHVRSGGGGHHVYLGHPGWRVLTLNHKSKRALAAQWPGLDIRGDGGYAVFCGRNRNGDYQWLRNPVPDHFDLLPEDLRACMGLVHAQNSGSRNQRHRGPASHNGSNGRVSPRVLVGRAIELAQIEGRNNTGFWLACQLRDNRFPKPEAEAIMNEYVCGVLSVNLHGQVEPYTGREALASLDQAYSRPPRESLTRRGMSANAIEASLEFHPTDIGNAEELVARHGRDLRFCKSLGGWLVWDSTRWSLDVKGRVELMAKDTVRALYAEASACPDSSKRQVIAKHALKSESDARVKAMLERAKAEPDVAVEISDLDTDPWLLNCTNGTVDLRTGTIRAHRREDLLTKLSPVKYDSDARNELFDRFLAETTGSDSELMGFLQRATGYSLTGDTSEEKLFLVHGPGNTGKSSYLEAVKAVLGDYAATADFETFLARKNATGPRNDIARLTGARLVLSIEVEHGRRLAEGLVKTLTGGDTVAARFLHREFFEFKPTFKLWLCANRAPRVAADDSAMWRRILRLPFAHVVPIEDRDPRIKVALRDPEECGPAILAWAVTGCVRWRQSGLAVPHLVSSATERYRLDQDPLKDFLADTCVLKPEARTASKDLWEAYKSWAAQNGEHLISRRHLAELLEARGCEQGRTGHVRFWQGIGLLAAEAV